MSNLNDFYKMQKINYFEGHTQQVPEQIKFLKNIVGNKSIINVMEIGFNGGHSSEIFLSSNKNINLVSFDDASHEYVKLGKQFIDKNYFGRHELIIGDSLITVPEYSKKTNKKFDLIFIDGGHSYDISKGDLLNCKHLANDKTIVIMDDTMTNMNWREHYNHGPTIAWEEAKKMNIIKEIGSIDYLPGRGNSWGYYI